jgi:hypothetical protein
VHAARTCLFFFFSNGLRLPLKKNFNNSVSGYTHEAPFETLEIGIEVEDYFSSKKSF